MKWLSAVVPFVVAPPLLILAAIWQGKETERWGEIPEMKEFAARLQQLPLNIGPWHGVAGNGLSPAMRKAAGAEGDMTIVYTNEVTGEKARMFIVVGRLLDVSKHRPDRCYPAQGYKSEGDEEPALQKVTTAENSKVEFRTARYARDDEKLRIYWSWASDRVWKGPDGEDGLRKEFHRTRPIYKMYVDNPVGKIGDHADEGPSIDLIKVLVPAYDKVLFPPTENASRSAPVSKSTSAKSVVPSQKPVARVGGAGVASSERATSSGSIV